MLISELLTPARVIPALKANNKKQVLTELASVASKELQTDEQAVLDVLVERERLGTTAMGEGVAIPHGKLDGLDGIFLIFARADRPVPFDAPDGRPADLFFLLLTPENAGADHLTALAKLSRLLRDRRMCAVLRGSDDPEVIYSAILESEQK